MPLCRSEIVKGNFEKSSCFNVTQKAVVCISFFAHADTGCVVHRVRNGSGDSRQTDLSDPARPELVDFFVRESRKYTSMGGASFTATI